MSGILTNNLGRAGGLMKAPAAGHLTLLESQLTGSGTPTEMTFNTNIESHFDTYDELRFQFGGFNPSALESLVLQWSADDFSTINNTAHGVRSVSENGEEQQIASTASMESPLQTKTTYQVSGMIDGVVVIHCGKGNGTGYATFETVVVAQTADSGLRTTSNWGFHSGGQAIDALRFAWSGGGTFADDGWVKFVGIDYG